MSGAKDVLGRLWGKMFLEAANTSNGEGWVHYMNRAAALVAERGKEAFDHLRDKTGSFVFMDTYVFVDNLEGVELVNAAQPSLEGKKLINERDLKGKLVVREYIDAAVKNGSAWVHYYWYRPGENTQAQVHLRT